MATTHIDKDQTKQYGITTSNNHIVLDKGVTIDSPYSGINELPGLSNNEVVIQGKISAHGTMDQAAVTLQGTGTDLMIGESGRLKGNIGLNLNGNNETVVNRGRIESDGIGIAVAGSNVHIVNFGEIIADSSVAMFTNFTTGLRLDNHGLIRSDGGFDFRQASLELNFGKDSVVEFGYAAGIRTHSVAGWTATIRNDGEISHSKVGMSSAITGGLGSEIVRNTGTMTGFVDLDGGDDRYDGRGGRVLHGQILGGDGNDTYILDNSKDRVHDSVGWGYDTLKVSASYKLGVNNEIEETHLAGKGDFNLKGNSLSNYLDGNKGDNRLFGDAGDDAFFGGAGDDILSGGAGADGFYFKANADLEIITDFIDGEDLLILFPGDDIKNIADLIANHAHQHGADLVIEGDGTEMIIRNFDKANLTAADFTV